MTLTSSHQHVALAHDSKKQHAHAHSESPINGPTLSVHDPDFRALVTIPLSEVHHLPPAHLEISRLVLCRKYNAQDPHSCSMGDTCKFVHANLAHPSVTTQSIHVNYAWRSLEEVTEPRVAPGELVTVLAPNGRQPTQQIPSEFMLATRGALARHESETPLAHCAHYYFNRMCNRGERCNFVHAVFVDPNAGEWQRAPPRSGAGYADGRPLIGAPAAPVRQQAPVATPQQRPAAAAGIRFHTHANVRGSVASVLSGSVSSLDSAAARTPSPVQAKHIDVDGASSCDLSDNEEGLNRSSLCTSPAPQRTLTPDSRRVVYVHNPYSLLTVTKSWIEA